MELHGVNPQSAVAAIRERSARLAVGEERKDGRKLALVVEGGAMRGVISCGALLGLEELGMASVFDEVYGTSAGAVNAAYFLAGQAAYAVVIYYRDINNNRFIKPIWHRKLMDIDYLFDEVVARTKPLRVQNVLESPSKLLVVVGDAAAAQAFLVDVGSSQVPLVTILKASSAMQLFYNQRIQIEGRECFDGGLFNPIPIIEAIENGCTDILVLLTRPSDFRDVPPTRFESDLFKRRCAFGNPSLIEAFHQSYVQSNSLRDIALGRGSQFQNINIATLCPAADEPPIERTDTDAAKLKAAAIAGARRTLEAFGHPCEEFVEVLRPFPYFSSTSVQMRKIEEYPPAHSSLAKRWNFINALVARISR